MRPIAYRGGTKSLRDESRRTRIETPPWPILSATGRRVSEMNPEEQGLKRGRCRRAPR